MVPQEAKQSLFKSGCVTDEESHVLPGRVNHGGLGMGVGGLTWVGGVLRAGGGGSWVRTETK